MAFVLLAINTDFRWAKKEYYIDLLFYHRIIKMSGGSRIESSRIWTRICWQTWFLFTIIRRTIKAKGRQTKYWHFLLVPNKEPFRSRIYFKEYENKPIGVSEYILSKQPQKNGLENYQPQKNFKGLLFQPKQE